MLVYACACLRVCVCVCVLLRTHASGVWRNGSGSDSRTEGWEFKSLCTQYGLQLRSPFAMYREGRVNFCLSFYLSFSLCRLSVSLSLCFFVRCLSISLSVRLSVCQIEFNNQMPKAVCLSCLSQTHGFRAWKGMRVIMLVCVCVCARMCMCMSACLCVCLRTHASGVWRNGSTSDFRSEGWEFESPCPRNELQRRVDSEMYREGRVNFSVFLSVCLSLSFCRLSVSPFLSLYLSVFLSLCLCLFVSLSCVCARKTRTT